jgi:hypothetical protein
MGILKHLKWVVLMEEFLIKKWVRIKVDLIHKRCTSICHLKECKILRRVKILISILSMNILLAQLHSIKAIISKVLT